MNLFFRCIFMLAGTFAIMHLSAQRFTLLEQSLSPKSFVRQVCTSSLVSEYPLVCADCSTIAQVYAMNKRAAAIEINLYIVQQQKSHSSTSFFAKKLFERIQTSNLKALENQANNLSQEYNDAIRRLISIVDTKEDPNDVLDREITLVQQGLASAVNGICVDDSI